MAFNKSEMSFNRSISTTTSSGGRDADNFVKITQSRQIFRGISPTSASRLEVRVKELEDLLELERDARLRAERQNNELNFQLQTLDEKYMESGGLSALANGIIKKKETENLKLRKDLEMANLQIESNDLTSRKKTQAILTELSSEVETLQKQKGKSDKDKHTLLIEVEDLNNQLASNISARNAAEQKLNSVNNDLNRHKQLVNDLTQQNNELVAGRALLQSQNADLSNNVQECHIEINNISQTNISLQGQLSDARRRADEEMQARSALQNQVMSLHKDNDTLRLKYEEEFENGEGLRHKLSQLQLDMGALKSRLEAELSSKTEECEEIRRRFSVRIMELEDLYEREHTRANNLDKLKTQLTIEIQTLQSELDNALSANADLAQQLRDAHTLNAELQSRNDLLTNENLNLAQANKDLAADNMNLRNKFNELNAKFKELERENNKLGEALKAANLELNELRRRVPELEALAASLQADRENLARMLKDAEDALREKEQQLQATLHAMQQLRTEMEQRLRDKEEELESLKRTSQSIIEQLQITINELEIKYKSEISRLKKRFESTIAELENELTNVKRINATLVKENHSLGERVKILESMLEDERSAHEVALSQLQNSERRRIALQNELDALQAQFEASERARKNAEAELSEISTRISELTIQLQAANNEKRRLEGDLATLQNDLEEALKGRGAAEDRANHLNNEVGRLAAQVLAEQANAQKVESLKQRLEIEIRELSVKLEESESFARGEGRRLLGQLQARVRELETALEAESRHAKDSAALASKFKRQLKGVTDQSEEDRRTVLELQGLLDKTQAKLKAYKRQLDEAEEVTALTINKYKKAQQEVDQAEQKAELIQRSSFSSRHRSLGPKESSVVREVITTSSSSTRRGARATSIY